jgi:hypothetical protein
VSQQPPKKPASRDINDLKARLGIKKGTSPQTPVGSKTAGMPGRGASAGASGAAAPRRGHRPSPPSPSSPTRPKIPSAP